MSSYVNSGTPQLFKFLYPNQGFQNLVTGNRPLINMVPKKAAATGLGSTTGIVHVWNYSNPQGVSQSYGSALLQQDSLVTGSQLYMQLSQFFQFFRLNA